MNALSLDKLSKNVLQSNITFLKRFMRHSNRVLFFDSNLVQVRILERFSLYVVLLGNVFCKGRTCGKDLKEANFLICILNLSSASGVKSNLKL